MTAPLEQRISAGLRRQEAGSRELLAGGARRLGWKAGFGTAAAVEKLGTQGPLAGFLTAATLHPSGTSFDVSDWAKPVLEPELAVRLATDVRAGQDRSATEVAIAEVGAAIELVDLGEAGEDAGEILAANVFHRALLLGDLIPLAAGASLAEARIDVRSDGQAHALGADPSDLLGDLVEVLIGMADLLAGSEDGLRAGDVVITGAAIKPFELSGGERVEVSVGTSSVLACIAQP